MLGRVIQFEEKHEATMIMHRHLLESIGLAALNHKSWMRRLAVRFGFFQSVF